MPGEEEVVPENLGEEHHGMTRMCSRGLLSDCCPHPESIVLAAGAVVGIGSYSHLLVAGVWAERWDVDWVGGEEVLEVRVDGIVPVVVDASGAIDVEAKEVGADDADEEIDGRIDPCLSFAPLALDVRGWLAFGLWSGP